MEISALMATAAYARGAAIQPEGEGGSAFHRVAQEFEDRLRNTERTARAAMLGQADPHALVEALASSQTAVETVAAIRDRVVEAYQEILRMPV